MGLAIAILLLIPYLGTPNIRSPIFRPVHAFLYFFFVFDVIFLGWLGAQVVEPPFVFLGQAATFFYFFTILFMMPTALRFENSCGLLSVYEKLKIGLCKSLLNAKPVIYFFKQLKVTYHRFV
jgi:ubiquinol-cytochrome c reductase cytochrome b subunit